MHSHHLREPHRRHGTIAQFFSEGMRVIIFGLEDSLVSTLGALTGIAAGTANHFFIVLSGVVIIIAEALSMTAGEYLSSKSAQEVWKKKMDDEKKELIDEPEKEKAELVAFYMKKGFAPTEAHAIAEIVWKNEGWTLEEMAIHELDISPTMPERPKQNAIAMFVSYILGGVVTLLPYLLFSVTIAIPLSIASTGIALFVIGAIKTQVTEGKWWKSGLEMLSVSLATALVSYLLGIGIARLIDGAHIF